MFSSVPPQGSLKVYVMSPHTEASMFKVIREDGSSIWVLTGPTWEHAWQWAEKHEPNAAYVWCVFDKRMVSYSEFKGI